MDNKIKVLIEREELQKRIGEIANEINTEFAGDRITLVCVLKGGVMFFADLAKKLTVDVEFDFLDVSSYGSNYVSSGVVKIKKDLDYPITGKKVVVVEDIIDTGHSMALIKNHLLSQKPALLKTCILLDKPERRENFEVTPDYLGFSIPNKFVVGYGLDNEQIERNLDYIGYIQV